MSYGLFLPFCNQWATENEGKEELNIESLVEQCFEPKQFDYRARSSNHYNTVTRMGFLLRDVYPLRQTVLGKVLALHCG